MQITDDPPGMRYFLSKFPVLRNFYQAPEVIDQVAYEVVAAAARDNIKYMELRFTPPALAHARGFSFQEVTDWVCAAVARAQRDFAIKVRLIMCLNRHEGPDVGEKLVQIAVDYADRGFVGVDLAGDEVGFPARPFGPLFFEARRSGLGVTIHAGEWMGPENIRDAIENMGAQRIGHGVRVVEDSNVAHLAREMGVAFEVCPTSNLQSGVIGSLEEHPLPDMYFPGLPVTLNTDDPCVSGIPLANEFSVAAEGLGFDEEALKQIILNAVQASFLPADERAELAAWYRQALGLE